MHDLPAGWSALCAVAFLLGLRHGLDADHLAAVDGMTRLSHRARPGLSRWCGALFSLGHGAVVMSIAGAVGVMSGGWSVPSWLASTGGWVSVAFLTVLGLANLRAALRAAPGTVVGLVGCKGALVRRILAARSPWQAAAVGALFALSFDTLGQAAFFAVTATRFGGVPEALALGALFVLGMLLVDGLDGWWIAHLMSRADRLAAFASRAMAFVVAAVSLLVAAWGGARLGSPAVDRWSAGREPLMGAGVVAAIALGFLATWLWTRRGPARRDARPTPHEGMAGSVGC